MSRGIVFSSGAWTAGIEATDGVNIDRAPRPFENFKGMTIDQAKRHLTELQVPYRVADDVVQFCTFDLDPK